MLRFYLGFSLPSTFITFLVNGLIEDIGQRLIAFILLGIVFFNVTWIMSQTENVLTSFVTGTLSGILVGVVVTIGNNSAETILACYPDFPSTAASVILLKYLVPIAAYSIGGSLPWELQRI